MLQYTIWKSNFQIWLCAQDLSFRLFFDPFGVGGVGFNFKFYVDTRSEKSFSKN